MEVGIPEAIDIIAVDEFAVALRSHQPRRDPARERREPAVELPAHVDVIGLRIILEAVFGAHDVAVASGDGYAFKLTCRVYSLGVMLYNDVKIVGAFAIPENHANTLAFLL